MPCSVGRSGSSALGREPAGAVEAVDPEAARADSAGARSLWGAADAVSESSAMIATGRTVAAMTTGGMRRTIARWYESRRALRRHRRRNEAGPPSDVGQGPQKS